MVACTVGPQDDLLVTYLAADLHDVHQVAVIMESGGHQLARIDDAPIDARTGRVICTWGGDVARTFPAMTIAVRLLGTDADPPRSLGEYTFVHTPHHG